MRRGRSSVVICARTHGSWVSGRATREQQKRGIGASRRSIHHLVTFFSSITMINSSQMLSRKCLGMAHSDVGLLVCQFQDISADGSKLGIGKKSRWAPGKIFPRKLGDGEVETPFVTFFCATGQGPFALYRRSVYVQTDGWDTTFWPHEDTDMFCQMALLSKVHFLPEPLYLKRVHPAQGMSDGARVQRSYTAFRAKWDTRQPKNAHEAALLS